MQNTADRATAEAVRQGAIAYAGLFLDEDLRQGTTDTLKEKWNQPLVLPVDGGTVAISATDAQARFNLNNLFRGAPPPAAPGSPPSHPAAAGLSRADIGAFHSLLTTLKLDGTLTEALIDWIDPDSQAGASGGEDVEYATLSPPYRAANQPLQSVDELRLIKGFTPEVVEALRPFVIALPAATEINVNTASETVLATLFKQGGDVAAKQIVTVRDNKPFQSVAEFNSARPQGIPEPTAGSFGVATSYFVLNIDVRVGRIWSRTETLIKREGNRKTTVLWQRPRPLVITRDEEST
jgi:general secretion pathway protein K